MSARNVVIVVVVIILLIGGYLFVKMRGVRQEAVKWEGPIPEIVMEDIKPEGDAMRIHLSSRIDAPPAVVFAAFGQPERLEGAAPEIKKATVLSGDDQKKQVELHIQVLGQLQVITVDLTYDKQNNVVGIKTVEGAIDLDGKYKLEPSPDGKKTLVDYTAVQKNKLPLPIPQDVQRSAIKEQFANMMKAIKKRLGEDGKLTSAVAFELRAAA